MNINFMRFRKIAITISLVMFVGSIGSIFMKGLSLGLDFSGGTLVEIQYEDCLLYTSPSPRDAIPSRMPSSA